MKTEHYPQVVNCDKEPSKAMPGTLYLIGPPGAAPGLIFFLCPCGCVCELDLPLQGGPARPGRQSWQIERSDASTLSLSPSVNIPQGFGCGSHFNLKNNRIEWCT